jgi:hypothetical protein
MNQVVTRHAASIHRYEMSGTLHDRMKGSHRDASDDPQAIVSATVAVTMQ